MDVELSTRQMDVAAWLTFTLPPTVEMVTKVSIPQGPSTDTILDGRIRWLAVSFVRPVAIPRDL